MAIAHAAVRALSWIPEPAPVVATILNPDWADYVAWIYILGATSVSSDRVYRSSLTVNECGFPNHLSVSSADKIAYLFEVLGQVLSSTSTIDEMWCEADGTLVYNLAAGLDTTDYTSIFEFGRPWSFQVASPQTWTVSSKYSTECVESTTVLTLAENSVTMNWTSVVGLSTILIWFFPPEWRILPGLYTYILGGVSTLHTELDEWKYLPLDTCLWSTQLQL